MTTFNHSITIDRPLEEVWEYVVDPANDPVWQGPVVEVLSGTEGPIEVGSEIQEVTQFLGRRFDITFEVTEHEPMTRSAVRSKAGPVAMQGTYRFEPVDGGTRFSMEGETNAHGLFKLAEPVFARMARREWATCCEQLKDILEEDGASRNDSRTDGP
jgi:uncharacterized protein YndB with AHSA1/START domain